MKVHVVKQNGNHETLEAECVREAENGIYLLNGASTKLSYVTGYVPFERLDYVEPDE